MPGHRAAPSAVSPRAARTRGLLVLLLALLCPALPALAQTPPDQPPPAPVAPVAPVAPEASQALAAPQQPGYLERFKCPPLPPGMAEALPGIVSYAGDTLTIKARNGQTIDLKSVRNEDGGDVVHCVKDYFPEEGILLVETLFYEDVGFLAVNLNNGESVHLDGTYILSPDRKRLLHDNSFQYERQLVEILKITPCGLVQEQVHEADKALRQCVFAWDGNAAVTLTYRPESGEEPADKDMGRIVREQGRWIWKTTDLYRQAFTGQ